MVMHYQASHTAEVICFAGLVFGPVIRSKVHSRVNTGASLSGSHHQTTLFLFFFPKISSQRVVLEEVLGLLTPTVPPRRGEDMLQVLAECLARVDLEIQHLCRPFPSSVSRVC